MAFLRYIRGDLNLFRHTVINLVSLSDECLENLEKGTQNICKVGL